MDFVVSGASGFIGGHVSRYLRGLGYSVISDRELSVSPGRARFFVNCANNASDPLANAALMRRQWYLAKPHASVFIQIQSFATLHGSGRFSPERTNCGLRPGLLDPYALGKLLQEKTLLSLGNGPQIWLVFLPAVIGEGGSWSRVIANARSFGIVNPIASSSRGRPNFIEVDDLSRFLAEMAAKGDAKPALAPRRFVLSRPEAKTLTWNQFLGGMTSNDGHEPTLSETHRTPGAGARLKEALRWLAMLAIAFAWRTGAIALLERLARRSSENAPARPRGDSAVQAAGPVEFRGLTRYLAESQPYLSQVTE